MLRSTIGIAGAALTAVLTAAPPAGAGELECRELESRVAQKHAVLEALQLNRFLFEAAEKGCTKLGQALISRGANPQARRREGESALHHAARAGEEEFAAMLIAHGAKIEQRDLQGSTPLFLAVEHNRSKMVTLLLDNGAKPDVPGRSGVSPLAAAAFNGSDAIVDLLLRKGADVNAEDVTGKTAIAYAAARGFSGIVEQLLGAGVDINRRYGNDLTVLMWAAGYANDVTEAEGLETVDLLIARGARLDDADNRGRTALMTACEMGHAAVAARLIEAGADPTLRDKDGKTALDLAADDSVRAALVRP